MTINDATPSEWDRASASLDKPDPVEKPAHYRVGEVECIDYIHQQLGSGVKDYLRGQVYKYMHRHQYKGAEVEDLRKARWYIDRLIYELVQEEL